MLLKKIYLPIGILIVVICAIGFLSLRSDVPDEPIVIYKPTTKESETPAKETETATSETATGGHKHDDSTEHSSALLDVESQQSHFGNNNVLQKSDEVDMPLDHTHDLVNSSDEDYRKREQRRAELSQRVIELTKGTELLSQAYLGSVDTELSLMNSFLAGISKTEREIARQGLLKLYPDEARDVNDFFIEIENAPNLSRLEISEKAKSLIASREAREVMRQQHDAKWEQLRIELDEFYGDELSNALENIKSQKGRE